MGNLIETLEQKVNRWQYDWAIARTKEGQRRVKKQVSIRLKNKQIYIFDLKFGSKTYRK